MLHTYRLEYTDCIAQLNNALAYADSAAGSQYSKNRGNPRNRGDLSPLKVNRENQVLFSYDNILFGFRQTLHQYRQTLFPESTDGRSDAMKASQFSIGHFERVMIVHFICM